MSFPTFYTIDAKKNGVRNVTIEPFKQVRVILVSNITESKNVMIQCPNKVEMSTPSPSKWFVSKNRVQLKLEQEVKTSTEQTVFMYSLEVFHPSPFDGNDEMLKWHEIEITFKNNSWVNQSVRVYCNSLLVFDAKNISTSSCPSGCPSGCESGCEHEFGYQHLGYTAHSLRDAILESFTQQSGKEDSHFIKMCC